MSGAGSQVSTDNSYSPFMILSHHRSGSNFLTDLVQANERIECISEPLSMHTDFRRFDLETWTREDFVPSDLHPQLRRVPGIAAFIRKLRDWMYQAPAGMVRGIKETLLFDKLPWWQRIFPSLKVIWLVRDPRAVVHSVLQCGLWELWEYPQRVGGFCRAYYGDQGIDPISPAEMTLWSWKVRHQLACQHLQAFDYLCVRMEDLVECPQRELARIAELIGPLGPASQKLYMSRPSAESRGGTFSTIRNGRDVLEGWKTGLSDDARLYVENLASEEMASLGYA